MNAYYKGDDILINGLGANRNFPSDDGIDVSDVIHKYFSVGGVWGGATIVGQRWDGKGWKDQPTSSLTADGEKTEYPPGNYTKWRFNVSGATATTALVLQYRLRQAA